MSFIWSVSIECLFCAIVLSQCIDWIRDWVCLYQPVRSIYVKTLKSTWNSALYSHSDCLWFKLFVCWSTEWKQQNVPLSKIVTDCPHTLYMFTTWKDDSTTAAGWGTWLISHFVIYFNAVVSRFQTEINTHTSNTLFWLRKGSSCWGSVTSIKWAQTKQNWYEPSPVSS